MIFFCQSTITFRSIFSIIVGHNISRIKSKLIRNLCAENTWHELFVSNDNDYGSPARHSNEFPPIFLHQIIVQVWLFACRHRGILLGGEWAQTLLAFL